MNEHGALMEWYRHRKTEVLREKLVPLSLHLLKSVMDHYEMLSSQHWQEFEYCGTKQLQYLWYYCNWRDCMCWCEVSKTISTSVVCHAMEKLFLMLRREGESVCEWVSVRGLWWYHCFCYHMVSISRLLFIDSIVLLIELLVGAHSR